MKSTQLSDRELKMNGEQSSTIMKGASHKTEEKDYSAQLTEAEKRVLFLVSLAKTNKEIASALDISPATVKRHLENILRKAHLKNRVEAAIYGLIVKGCPHASRQCALSSWQEKMTAGSNGPFGQ